MNTELFKQTENDYQNDIKYLLKMQYNHKSCYYSQKNKNF